MSDDDIISRRIRGESVREIAKRKRTTQDRVAREISRWADTVVNDRTRRDTLALELSRLDKLQEVFYRRAVEEGDVASGHLVSKIIERRTVMLGLRTPQLHTLQIVDARPARTSTDRLEQALENLLEDKRRQQAEPAPAVIDGKVEPTQH